VPKRKYEMTRRAELEEQTRLRITESAVALHEKLGPARASISAIAENAGVRRSTVYRHFPDEEALFDACSSHWAAANPAPDLTGRDVRGTLEALYAWYARTEPMLTSLLRDAERVQPVKVRMEALRVWIASVADALAAGTPRGKARVRVRAAVGHALEFETWRSLTREQGLDQDEAIDLMTRLIQAAR
jgi:AcrR family transcriptional regulator